MKKGKTMKRINRFLNRVSLFVFLSVMGAGAFSLFAASLDAQGTTQKTSGSVQSVDWVRGKIVLKSSDSYSNAAVFDVAEDAELTSGSRNISLNDINQGDQVDIEYIRTQDTPKAVRINDKSSSSMTL